MIRGFYSAASSLMAGLFRQELISHNLANVNVAGYKEVNTSLGEFDRILLDRFSAGGPGNLASGTVGSTTLGVVTGGAVTDFAEGSLQQTSQPFDLAISGDGFFTLQSPDGERYTRDGRFTRDTNGNLVSVDGYLLMGNNGQPVNVPEGEVTIEPTGLIRVDNTEVGQISLMTFADTAADLKRDGQNTFIALNPGQANENANVRQGYLEMSNVDPARAMTQMMTVARAYEAAQRAMQLQDEMLGKAVNEIGTV
jgi:flagellar basal-body rod protein FlgF